MIQHLSLRSLACVGLWLALGCCGLTFAQDQQPPTVTAAAATEQARFLADNEVALIRLEVFALGDTRLYDSDFKPGNLLEWNWRDQQGQALADGTYRCLVTIKDLAGQSYQRQGVLQIQNSLASWLASEPAEALLNNNAPAQRIAYFATVPNASGLAAAGLAHDGNEARLMTGNGGLSVRTGNFLTGDEQEKLRLTAEGKLAVKGAISTGEGIVFPDGTVQKTAYVASGQVLKQIADDGKKLSPSAPAVGGSGTPNVLMKWAANGVDATNSSVTDNGPGGGITVNGGVQSTFYEASASGTFLSFKPAIAGSAFLLRSNSLSGNLWIGHLGNVGLNASEPASRFATGGNATIGAGYYNVAAPANSLVVEGNVGIGTPSPTAPLHIVIPGAPARALSFSTPSGGVGMSLFNGLGRADVRYNGNTLNLVNFSGGVPPNTNGIAIDLSGNVGVGTETPANKLDVNGGVRAFFNNSTGMVAETTGGTNAWARLYAITPSQRWFMGTSRNFNGNQFYLVDDTFGATRMSIQPNGGTIAFPLGDVGIGTSSPTAKLHVVGTTKTGILEITNGSDLAEHFTLTEEVKAGFVVAIDPRQTGKLALARGAYNRRVAGIISGANNLSVGMVLPDANGAESANPSRPTSPVALSGRVWVHCDATQKSIQPGDLLTTAHTPGHAMKVRNYQRAQGAIIGKAMTGLKAGKGMVLVLVTLQ